MEVSKSILAPMNNLPATLTKPIGSWPFIAVKVVHLHSLHVTNYSKTIDLLIPGEINFLVGPPVVRTLVPLL